MSDILDASWVRASRRLSGSYHNQLTAPRAAGSAPFTHSTRFQLAQGGPFTFHLSPVCLGVFSAWPEIFFFAKRLTRSLQVDAVATILLFCEPQDSTGEH